MFPELHGRAKKVGQPPGTLIYTGDNKQIPRVTITTYSPTEFIQLDNATADKFPTSINESAVTWIDIEGLSDVSLIKQITKPYNLHPLTLEDILNVEQRSKIEEFDGYIFITTKTITPTKSLFSIDQFSIIFGKNFVLTFQEKQNTLFSTIRQRLQSTRTQSLRQQGSDYLVYRLLDALIDQYFLVLEDLGENIEEIEDLIIKSPTPQNSRTLYRLKRQMLRIRKAIWPMREVVSHLLQVEEPFVTAFTRLYLRDVYDHTMQAIDTIETFRDMLASMLDVYLSSLSNRMNEIMKILTIISTIFIPITFLSSLYGMNFQYMPELHYRAGYPIVLCVMVIMTIIMLLFFRKKKWI